MSVMTENLIEILKIEIEGNKSSLLKEKILEWLMEEGRMHLLEISYRYNCKIEMMHVEDDVVKIHLRRNA